MILKCQHSCTRASSPGSLTGRWRGDEGGGGGKEPRPQESLGPRLPCTHILCIIPCYEESIAIVLHVKSLHAGGRTNRLSPMGPPLSTLPYCLGGGRWHWGFLLILGNLPLYTCNPLITSYCAKEQIAFPVRSHFALLTVSINMKP